MNKIFLYVLLGSFSYCLGAKVQSSEGLQIVHNGSICHAILTPAVLEGGNFQQMLKILRKHNEKVVLDCFAPIKSADLMLLLHVDGVVLYYFWDCKNINDIALAVIDKKNKLKTPEDKFIYTLIYNNFIPSLSSQGPQNLYFFPTPESFVGKETNPLYKEVIDDGKETLKDGFLNEYVPYSRFAEWVIGKTPK